MDFAKYHSALYLADGWAVLPHGGVTKIPGFGLINEAKFNDKG